MGTVHKIHPDMHTVVLGSAIDAFLAENPSPGTRRAYAGTLGALVAEVGGTIPLAELAEPERADQLVAWFRQRWDETAPATFNRNLNALRSAIRYWQQQSWLPSDPTLPLRRRVLPPDRTRALSQAQIDKLLSREDIGLRERVLWRLLYESAARASEVLALDVADLDLPNRQARVRRKSGPVFLTKRKARVALSPADLDPASGKARLSYRRAAEIFEETTGGCTLHQLRHSALTHEAERGTSTPVLMGISGHTSVRSLSKYARVSPEAVARHYQQHDPDRRR